MNFIEKTAPKGHLTIVKIDKRTKEEEVIYDDSNVICGGMGQSIAQFMSTPKCADDSCETKEELPPECRMVHYQISHFQVGQGASGVNATSSVVSLVAPLEAIDYGTNNLVSVGVEPNSLWQNEDLMVDSSQIFGRIETQGTVENKLVSLWLLDEETANNTVIDEAGLFVRNPYIKTSGTFNVASPEPVVGQPSPDVETYVDGYAPGRLLAAYKQFNPIRKEAYFSLLFRWSIDFG